MPSLGTHWGAPFRASGEICAVIREIAPHDQPHVRFATFKTKLREGLDISVEEWEHCWKPLFAYITDLIDNVPAGVRARKGT
jgi:hypothetical protein